MGTKMTMIRGAARLRAVQGFSWLYPMALILVFAVLASLLPSAILREGLLVAFLGVIGLAAAANLIFARIPPGTAHRTFGDLVAIALIAVLLSSVFWFRAALGVSGWDGIGFGIIISLGWWLPAVAFAVLYRHPGKSWLAQGRGRFLARVAVAAVASLAGLPIQGVLQEHRPWNVTGTGPTS